MSAIRYRTAEVDGIKVFYREAQNVGAPKLLLLHGFPTAGHMFRDLIPAACRQIPYRRTGPSRLRLIRHAAARKIQVHVR